jgi:chromatin segregation and condensation protein Rec8/ScpA/Scc1 (kleisin family)
MPEEQSLLDRWFLKQEIIDELLAHGEDQQDAELFGARIAAIAATEEAEHQSLHDPFDRSVALVLSLVREEAFNPWNVDLSAFLSVFSRRVQEEENLDLPACGRLIRLSWEVLHHQSAVLFEKIQPQVEEEEWDEDMSFGWESEYDDEAYLFTQSILAGAADEVLPTLFDERLRRDEGRPVTLAELLSAFKDAADDATELKQRELNRLEHERELSEYLDNVGGRMHNEDLEGDIERCWNALRETCAAMGCATVPLLSVIEKLRPMLQTTFGMAPDECESEAFVASFIAGLFLTHRRMASISQEGEAVANIMIEDLWPNISTFAEVLEAVEEVMAEDADALDGQATGLDHRLEAIAERARLAEEREARRQAKLEASLAETISPDMVQAQDGSEQHQPTLDDSNSLDAHDWLVE